MATLTDTEQMMRGVLDPVLGLILRCALALHDHYTKGDTMTPRHVHRSQCR